MYQEHMPHDWSTDPKQMTIVLMDKIGCFKTCPTIATNPNCTLGYCSCYHGKGSPFAFSGRLHYCLAGKHCSPEDANYTLQKVAMPRDSVELAMGQGSVTGITVDPLRNDSEVPHPDWSMVALNPGHSKEQRAFALNLCSTDPKVLGVSQLQHSFGLRCRNIDFRDVRDKYGAGSLVSRAKPCNFHDVKAQINPVGPVPIPAFRPAPAHMQGAEVEALRTELKADISRIETYFSSSVNTLTNGIERNQLMAQQQFQAIIQSQNQLQSIIHDTVTSVKGFESLPDRIMLQVTQALAGANRVQLLPPHTLPRPRFILSPPSHLFHQPIVQLGLLGALGTPFTPQPFPAPNVDRSGENAVVHSLLPVPLHLLGPRFSPLRDARSPAGLSVRPRSRAQSPLGFPKSRPRRSQRLPTQEAFPNRYKRLQTAFVAAHPRLSPFHCPLQTARLTSYLPKLPL